jgi:hypothetical protein
MAQAAALRVDERGDIDVIRGVIQDYFDCMYESDPAKAERAFHEKAAIVGHLDGKPLWLSRAEFAGFVGSVPSPKKAGEPYDMQIVSLSVNGDTAVAIVRDTYLNKRFTDTLSLAKIAGRWAIANKVFTHE